MTTLRVVLAAPSTDGGRGRGHRRVSRELTAALVRFAPPGCSVEALVGRGERDVAAGIPGLGAIVELDHAAARLTSSWQRGHGIGHAGDGLVHSPSALAPLREHDATAQVSITIHDTVPWQLRDRSGEKYPGWVRAMAKRAVKYADAVIVPTHAVAEELGHFVEFGDRIRVIGGAVSPTVALPTDDDVADDVARRLALPARYIATAATLDPLKGLRPLLDALAEPSTPLTHLVVLGPTAWRGRRVTDLAREAGLAAGSVQVLDGLDDAGVAVVLARAQAFIAPQLVAGFGLGMLEAMSLGTPVVHADAPALAEVTDHAGVSVERGAATGVVGDTSGYSERLGAAISALLGDAARRDRLSVLGLDRSRAYSWRDSAERLWQLHADL